MSVITDYLTVSYDPDDSVAYPVSRFAIDLGGVCDSSDGKVSVFRFPEVYGVLRIEQRAAYHSILASGTVLSFLRMNDAYLQFLTLLSESPHRVTRLDVALDLPEDTPAVLKRLYRRYLRTPPSFSRKTQKIRRLLENRASDGATTGTLYIGERNHIIHARIYDKQAEQLAKGNFIPPTTRYEIQIKQKASDKRPSLRDAAEPSSIFWKYACPTLFQAKPSDVPEWSPSDYPDRLTRKLKPTSSLTRLERQLESPEMIATLSALAEEIGPSSIGFARQSFERTLHAIETRLNYPHPKREEDD